MHVVIIVKWHNFSSEVKGYHFVATQFRVVSDENVQSTNSTAVYNLNLAEESVAL